MDILKPEEAISFMLNGGKCFRKKNKQTILYKDGKFIIEYTGTLVGNFNNLEKSEDRK